MLGSHLQPSAHMVLDEFACIAMVHLINIYIACVMQNEVVADTTSDEALLDSFDRIYSVIDVEQGTVVGIQVGADLRVDARGFLASLANLEVLSVHAVHIGTWTSQVADVTAEVGHRYNLSYLS